jgi:hypothetical protein
VIQYAWLQRQIARRALWILPNISQERFRMPKVFISYRRADTGDLCDRLATRLRWALGEDAVFRDVNTILAGSSFPDALREGIEACPVTLALIGPSWLTPVGSPPRRRLDDADDWVRVEIATALRLGHLVVPVCAPGAPDLAAANLPADLALLAQYTSTPLRPDPLFDGDMRALLHAIRPYTKSGVASWFLLLGGAFLTLMFLVQIPQLSNFAFYAQLLFSATPTGELPTWLATFAWELTWMGQIALGAYALWKAFLGGLNHEWRWFAFGLATLLLGLGQELATAAATTDALEALLHGVSTFVWPLVAGLCLVAGWIGPRRPYAPDALHARWSIWRRVTVIALIVTCAAMVSVWVMLALAFSVSGLGRLFPRLCLALGVAMLVTGTLVAIQALVARQWWRSGGALALGVAASAAVLLFAFSTTENLLIEATLAAGSTLLSVMLALYTYAWLTSYTARLPRASALRGADLAGERVT